MMKIAIKVVIFYGIWSLIWIGIAVYGALFSNHGEFGISAHLWLTITGLPLSLLSWYVIPNGSVLGAFIAGFIGMLQWCAVAEGSARWNARRKANSNAT